MDVKFAFRRNPNPGESPENQLHKLSEIKLKEDASFSKELEASAEISKLREIVLDISEGSEQYFSTT